MAVRCTECVCSIVQVLVCVCVCVCVPDVVGLAVDVAVAHKARACLVEQLLTVAAAQTLCVPLHVWRHSQHILVDYQLTTAHTRELRRCPHPHPLLLLL